MIIKIKTNAVMTFSEDQSWLSFENMQDFVEGCIEIIQLSPTTLLVVNEEGRMRGLAINTAATFATKDLALLEHPPIVGNAILVSAPHFIE